MGLRRWFGQVNAHLRGQGGRCWPTAPESLRRLRAGLREHRLAGVIDPLRLPRVHRRRGHVADARVAMLQVVPGKEFLAEGAGLGLGLEALGELGLILERLKVGLGVRVVVAHRGPAMALGDLQIDEQHGHRFRAHGGAAIGVQGQLSREDAFLLAGGGDQLFGEFSTLAPCEHPAHHVAAEHIEDHVPMETRPLRRPLELGDVP